LKSAHNLTDVYLNIIGNSDASPMLRFTNLKIMSPKKCRELVDPNEPLFAYTICLDTSGGKAACVVKCKLKMSSIVLSPAPVYIFLCITVMKEAKIKYFVPECELFIQNCQK